ncbi:hypothetical protein DH2020_025099 [Rehmannia glutinosa]|uniref:MADS-box domain-containing protein n=1 Tax=Rehmannia glutinosa TaxID=99300 RepID=A0ABR0W2E8_REHGL
MGRKKLAMRRIENASARQVTYTKRKDGIVKKANELSVLCDTDVALIMFSPTGRLTSFASNGSRVEDIFLRFVDRPDELRGGPINNEEAQAVKVRGRNAGKDSNVTTCLLIKEKKIRKWEIQGVLWIDLDHWITSYDLEPRSGWNSCNLMVPVLPLAKDLEEKLDKLNRRQRESQEKMRYYEPNVEKINSVLEAGVYQQFLTSAIQRIQLSKAKLLGNQLVPERTENIEGTIAQMEDATSVTDYSVDGNQNGINSMRDEDQSGTSLSMGPHLSLSFIEAQKQWNKMGSEMSPPSFDNY